MLFVHGLIDKKIVGVCAAVAVLLAPSAAAAATRLHVITFDDPANGFASGDAVGEIRTDAGTVRVRGTGPRNPQPNDAMIFDATCRATCNPPDPDSAAGRADRQVRRRCGRCTGGDEDLRQPEQRNILIVSESGLPADPGDSGFGGVLTFDFSSIGVVRIDSLVVIDLEADSPATARLYRDDALVARHELPTPGDGRRATAPIGVSGIDRLEIEFAGSGAIDDLAFCVGDDPAVECLPATPAATSRPSTPTRPADRGRVPSSEDTDPATPVPPAISGEPEGGRGVEPGTGPVPPTTPEPPPREPGVAPPTPETTPPEEPSRIGEPSSAGDTRDRTAVSTGPAPTAPEEPAPTGDQGDRTGVTTGPEPAPPDEPAAPGDPDDRTGVTTTADPPARRPQGDPSEPTRPGAGDPAEPVTVAPGGASPGGTGRGVPEVGDDPSSRSPGAQPPGPASPLPSENGSGARPRATGPPPPARLASNGAGWPPIWIWVLLVLLAAGILFAPRLRASKSVDYDVVQHAHRARWWVSAPRFDGPDYDLDIRLRGAGDRGHQKITED